MLVAGWIVVEDSTDARLAMFLLAVLRGSLSFSSPDSEESYDLVNGASAVPSQAPSSPKEKGKSEDSEEEEDWE